MSRKASATDLDVSSECDANSSCSSHDSWGVPLMGEGDKLEGGWESEREEEEGSEREREEEAGNERDREEEAEMEREMEEAEERKRRKEEMSRALEENPCLIVNTVSAITALIDNSLVNLVGSSLTDEKPIRPSLYIDLEGVNLSRHGTVSLLQMFVLPQEEVYIIDVHTLGGEAFSTPGTNGQTLKTILESDAISKAFFDVRNDSDALYSHYGIKLAGIHDVQVMAFATQDRGNFLSGLARCINDDVKASPADHRKWDTIKRMGPGLYEPDENGSYKVNERPLSTEVQVYCALDVQLLPILWTKYWTKLEKMLKFNKRRVEDAAGDRVKESQREDYEPNGREKAIGPWKNR